MNFRERLWRLMSGRYGVDETFFLLTAAAAALALVNGFLRNAWLQLAVYIIMILALIRVFSRNSEQRRRENRAVKAFTEKLSAYRKEKERRRADFRHIYKKCPHCKAVLRLPRRKGKHKTICPRCGKKLSVYVFREYQ